MSAGVAAVAIVLGATAPVRAQSTAQAQAEGRERFRRGVELYREGNYRGALIEFKRANQVAPSFRIHYNIAQTCLELHDYACALQGYESYLRTGGKDVPKDRRAISEKELARLRKLVATLEIVSNKDGAEVELDDVSAGRTPLAPVLVGVGRHKVTVSLAPLPAVSKVVEVAGGDRVEVRLDLSEAPLPASDPAAPPLEAAPPPAPAPAVVGTPSPPTRAPSRTPLYVGLVATGVLAAGSGVSGALALGAKSDLDATVARIDPASSDIEDARSQLRTWSTVADVLLVSTVVAAGITTVLFFTSRSSAARAASGATAPVLGTVF